MGFLEEYRKAEDENKSSKLKRQKGKVKTAMAAINSDTSSDFAKQLKQQQQKTGSLLGQMKSLLTAFQASLLSPFKQSSLVKSNSGDRGRDRWRGRGNEDGDAEVIVEGVIDLEVGASPGTPTAGTNPTTE